MIGKSFLIIRLNRPTNFMTVFSTPDIFSHYLTCHHHVKIANYVKKGKDTIIINNNIRRIIRAWT